MPTSLYNSDGGDSDKHSEAISSLQAEVGELREVLSDLQQQRCLSASSRNLSKGQ